MKKIYILLFSFLASASMFGQTSFSGNGQTGFGGPVGLGSLKINNSSTADTFTFVKGTGGLNDVVVIYLDTKSGGITSTSGLNDATNGYTIAVSGYDSPTQGSILTFPAGFQPDYAIAFDKASANLYDISAGTSPITLIATLANFGNDANAASYTFTATKNQLGITGTSFKFLGAYISNTAYRANEFIGDAGPATGNPGFNQPGSNYTASTYDTYTLSTLPVAITSFSGRSVSNGVQLSWTTEKELNVNNYAIYRGSANGNFLQVGSVAATHNHTYDFTDVNAVLGNNFYQLVAVDRDGALTKSDIIKVEALHGVKGVKSFVDQSNNLFVRISGMDKGLYTVRVVNNLGQVVVSKSINHSDDATYQVSLPATMVKGVYHVSVNNTSNAFNNAVMVK